LIVSLIGPTLIVLLFCPKCIEIARKFSPEGLMCFIEDELVSKSQSLQTHWVLIDFVPNGLSQLLVMAKEFFPLRYKLVVKCIFLLPRYRVSDDRPPEAREVENNAAPLERTACKEYLE
jgi:hypothetical protein